MRKERRLSGGGTRSARIVSPSDDILSRVSAPGFPNVMASSFIPSRQFSGSPLVSTNSLPIGITIPGSPPAQPLASPDQSRRSFEFLPAQTGMRATYPSIVINGMIGDVMDAVREIMGRSSAPPVEPTGEISYVCPLSWVPITCPGRGVRCHHAQCFDLVEFLILAGNDPWVCPVCGMALDFESLRFDHAFMKDGLQHMGPVQEARSPGVVPSEQDWAHQDDGFFF